MAEVGGVYEPGTEEIRLGATRGLLIHTRAVASSTSFQPRQDMSSCGVILLPDPLGFDTAETRALAGVLSSHGYATLIPDIYRGETVPVGIEPSGKALLEWCATQEKSQMVTDVKESLVFLRERGVTRLAAVGLSFGAEIVLECAALADVFDAAVAFYPTTPSVGARTCIPTLFVFGGADELASPQAVASLREHLVQGGTVSEAKVIAGQPHHFVLLGSDAAVIKEAHAQLLGWIGTHVHANSGAWEVGRLTRIPLKEEDWWPEGKGRRFRSAARERWERAREIWRVQRRPRPARPPRVAYDSVVEGLAATRRTFELPGRMTLPEIIEVFTDIWEVESTL